MKIVDLNDLNGLPDKFFKKLNRNKNIFLKTHFFDEIKDNDVIENLINEINEYCKSNFIIGYHYTNANPEDIFSNGILSRTGEEIINDLINKYGKLFSIEEINLIKLQWEKYYTAIQKETRDKMIYFNFTLDAFPGPGTEELLKYFGGEQLYMAIDIESVWKKLEQVGMPLIIKAALEPKDIYPNVGCIWGEIAVSTYHKMQNPKACRKDIDGYQIRPVVSSRIYDIIKV
jgi:hypothetical protein